MKEIITVGDNEVNELFVNIKDLVNQSRNKVYKTVNTEMINLYWNIGKMIVDKQSGNKRAKYGDLLIECISKKLTDTFGKGFSIQNLRRMRQFYMTYPIRSTVLSKLSISHYYELIKIKDEAKRNFYMHECINSNWDVRELQRQRTTLLYERIASSKDKSKVLELSTKGHDIYENKDIIKDPFVLEFLDIKENTNYLETDLENEIITLLKQNNISYFKGFNKLNIGDVKFEFLNTEFYDNENDNSNVIYLKINNYKFLFMGDAGNNREKSILEKYNLKDIDFLKVGHHGSKTSSSAYFINNINPKYSLISVGKNNRYGHPKEIVLSLLNKTNIYRTDLNGSVLIRLNKNGYKIRTCSP